MIFKLLALTTLALFLSCSDILVPESEENRNVEDFEAAWTHIDKVYPLFEFKKIDWDSIHTVYRARAEMTDGDEIYPLLYDLVGEIKDGHAKIHTKGGDGIRPYTPPRFVKDDKAFNPNLIRKYFDKPLQILAENAIAYEFITNNVGYVRLPTFGRVMRKNVDEIDKVVKYFTGADGVIIDVRDNNGGGSAGFVPIIERFIDSTISTGAAFRVDENFPQGNIVPNGSIHFTGPIVILINGATFSAGEVFVDVLSQLEYVTLIGDTTAGGGVSANSDARHFLPSGKSIKIHYEAILKLDGEPLEWNGVAPDIRVPQTEADIINGRDFQLEEAVELLSVN